MADKSIRNDKCFCGSGLKYKKCCQSKSNIELMSEDGLTAYEVMTLLNLSKDDIKKIVDEVNKGV